MQSGFLAFLALAAGESLGAVEVIGANALVGVDYVKLAQHADRRTGILGSDAAELDAAALADVRSS